MRADILCGQTDYISGGQSIAIYQSNAASCLVDRGRFFQNCLFKA
jgi:hypothetical protein